jgi:tape measure domain
MANDFGLKIGIEGEKEFKNALRDINQSFRVLGSEMNLVTSQFEKNDKSVQAITARKQVLTKEIDAQKEKITTLEAAHKNAADSFGESDRRTQNWAIQLNNAKAKLNEMERGLSVSNNQLLSHAKSTDDAAGSSEKLVKTTDEFGKSTEKGHASLKDIGGLMKESLVTGSGNAKTAITDLGKNMKEGFDDGKEKIKETGSNILQFAKDTIIGENSVKKLGDVLANKLNRSLNDTEKGADDLADSIDDAGSEMDEAGKDTKELGNEMDSTGKKTSVFGDVLKANLAADAIKAGLSAIVDMVKAVGAAVGDFVGKMVIQGGFDRAMNIEQAQFKLKGLGHDAESVDAIMENALASVRGTAYGLGDAATVAASSVAAGIKPGEDLERTLGLVADASAISGRSMDEMGAVFNKVAASNKVTGKEVNQLVQAGIPITQLLSETIGVSVEEVGKLVSEGKVGMPEFQAAIEKGMGGAALAIGGTFQGSLANAKAAFARIGESFLTPLTQSLTPALGIITGLVDDIGNGTLDDVDSKMDELQGILSEAGAELIGTIEPLIQNAITVVSAMLPMVVSVIVDLLPTLLDAGVDLILALLAGIVSALPQISEAAVQVLEKLLEGIISLLPTIVDMGMNLLFALLEGIVSVLPNLVEAAAQIILSLVQGIGDSLPELIPAIIETVITIVQTLIENLPLILDAALQLVLALTGGILDALPELIAALPEIILAIVDFIIESIPQIIEAGIELLVSLVEALPDIITAIVEAIPQIIDGIITAVIDSIPLIIEAGIKLIVSLIQALPQIITTIVAAIPQIVNSLVDALSGNIDKIIMAGVQLFVALIQNLPTIITEIVKAVPQIVTGLINAFMSMFSKFSEVGKNMIRGIWEGISGMGAWLWDKFRVFIRNTLGWVADVLGIRSPSTVFRDFIGKNMMLGLADGIDENADEVYDSVKDVAKELANTDLGLSSDFDVNTGIHYALDSAGAAVSIADLGYKLDSIAGIMMQMFPALLEALNVKVVLSDGTLVGKLAPEIDRNLALLRKRGLGVV